MNGEFTPPFETAASLEEKLKTMYSEVTVHPVRGIGTFVCKK